MEKVLKYVGKGAWQEVDASSVLPTDKVKPIDKQRRSPLKKLEELFEQIEKGIDTNGTASRKLDRLLDVFRIQKRSAKNVAIVNEHLAARGLHVHPAITLTLPRETNIQFSNVKVKQLGDLFPKESELGKFVIETESYWQLGIVGGIKQYSPKGTKDRLDFRGKTADDDVVVLELKREGGGKTSVEQVLRYAGMVHRENPQQKIQTVLVTGVQNHETALAIRGMHPEQRKDFKWYLYNYSAATNEISFEQVPEEELRPLELPTELQDAVNG